MIRYNSITEAEAKAARDAVAGSPLSGFMGGNLRGGYIVQRLEELWANKFKVKHAIACNSATSGLFAASYIVPRTKGSHFITTPFTMSATTAAPWLLGWSPRYQDIGDDYMISPDKYEKASFVVVTNLFGLPAGLAEWRKWCDDREMVLIEDNAQSILATENGVYAGTIGHIGVFSLNVHKHIQCGEGGIIVTNDHDLARNMRLFINHGELAGGYPGLNLRMTEYTAAIAISQLRRVDEIVTNRINQAEKIKNLFAEFKWIRQPKAQEGRRHVYYVVPFESEYRNHIEIPGIVKGYVEPLNRMKQFRDRAMPRAEHLHDRTFFYFSNCEWSVDDIDLEHMHAHLSRLDVKLRSGAIALP